jgi:DNA modification methylase/transcriptional regulator with XRE-family HTH domain
MLVLAVTASGADQIPPIIFALLEHMPDFHLPTSTAAKFSTLTCGLSNVRNDRVAAQRNTGTQQRCFRRSARMPGWASGGWQSAQRGRANRRKSVLTRPVNQAIFLIMKTPRKTPNSSRSNPLTPGSRLGTLLRAEREARGWTLEQIAKRLKVTKGYVSRLEGGKARPAVRMIDALAKTLQVDPNPLSILAGHIPADVGEILKSHPVEAPAVLRESFGDSAYVDTTSHTPSLRVSEEESRYTAGTSGYELVEGDCFSWFAERRPNTVHAIVTDPPYGLKEYTPKEKAKLRRGKGGVWRIPPTLDGCVRRPLPRFTVLSEEEKQELKGFFSRWAIGAMRVLVPGGHVFIATNPLLSHLVYTPMIEAGFEKRGEIIRLVQTLRGGDRPKNAHKEFEEVTVMPRSCWEPWGLFRKPCEGRVQDNLRKWKTGGLRRIGEEQPFCDVIRSSPTRSPERDIAPHPSLKPQAFMRQIVRAALPLGEGIVLDPFMGSGSTIAAAIAVGYQSIGIESDHEFSAMAKTAVPRLATFVPNGDGNGQLAGNGKTATRGQQSLFA